MVEDSMTEWEKVWWNHPRASDSESFKSGWEAALERVGKKLFTEEDVTRIVNELLAEDKQ